MMGRKEGIFPKVSKTGSFVLFDLALFTTIILFRGSFGGVGLLSGDVGAGETTRAGPAVQNADNGMT